MPGQLCWRLGVSVMAVIVLLGAAVPATAQEAPKRVRVGGLVQEAKLISQTKPEYPPEAKLARIQGKVVLEAVISTTGTVESLKVLSGHPLLAPAAVEAVRQWKYRPTHLNGEPVQVMTTVEVNFALDDSARVVASVEGAAQKPKLVSQVAPKYPPLAKQARIQGRVRLEAIIGGTGAVEQLTVMDGHPLLIEAAKEAVKQWRFEPAVVNGEPVSVITTITVSFALGEREAVTGRAASNSSVSSTPVWVESETQQGKLVSRVLPDYPPLAKQAHIQGVVRLEAIIAKNGDVESLNALSGHPLLLPAALDAVKQWKYAATLLNGEPVEVITRIEVNFTLP